MTTFAPGNAAEVAEIVRWAASSNTPLRIDGSGTRSAFGHGVAAEHGMRLSAMTGIASYEPTELVLTAAAGTPTDEVEAALAAHAQMLPFEPPRPGPLWGGESGGTLGGMFLSNASGPRRLHAGAARDHVLGVSAVNGRGEIWKAGGRVIKNVTGYDLPRLLAGSLGTLSIVTEITCKVLPRPARTATLTFPVESVAEATRRLLAVAASPLCATGLAHVPACCEGADSSLRGLGLVRLEGSVAGIAERERALRALLHPAPLALLPDDMARRAWAHLRDAVPVSTAEVVMRVSLPPAATPGLGAWLLARGERSWYLDNGGGWLWLGLASSVARETIPALRQQLAGNASAVIFRAPPSVKDACDVFQPLAPPMAALMRRIRSAFDPQGLLNPGRMYRD